MIDVKPYDLPDAVLYENKHCDDSIIVWQPDHLMAVIGYGSDPHSELAVDEVEAGDVPVFRRPSGGCSVILSMKMFAVSFVVRNEDQMLSRLYFSMFNNVIIRALNNLGVNDLSYEGISDIALLGRKIVGSALYRTKDRVFFHAIINVAETPATIDRLLAVPPRMPDYRQGRSHTEFVTSIEENGHSIAFQDFKHAVHNEWKRESVSQHVTRDL